MIVREIRQNEEKNFNQAADHPLQTWEWGEFRRQTGLKVIRLGEFEENQLKQVYQLTVHPLPFGRNQNIIWFPRGPMPHEQMLTALREVGEKEKAVYLKLEPNICAPVSEATARFEPIRSFLATQGCQRGKEIFIGHTLTLDLTKNENELLAALKPKTRYNLRLAQKNGIEVHEDNSPAAFETYLRLTKATTERQGFFAHTPEYHRQMWRTLQPSGLAHLFVASYQDQPLVTWILFTHKKTLYYPYGASSRKYSELMPAYAMMWAAIRFGKENGCTVFDLWGSLGQNPNETDPRYGFHRFKEGFGTELQEFLGTYDLVVNFAIYPFMRFAENGRDQLLRLKKRLRLSR